SLPGLGLWLEQLVAESTGKRGTGILPVAEEPLGDPEEYGEDRVFVYIRDRERPEPALDEALEALARAGHPLITVPCGGPLDLGRLFMLWELTVAVAGWSLSINPFDQPNVQQAKDATQAVLSAYRDSHELDEPAEATGAQLQSLLTGASPPQYVAIMAFLAPSLEFDRAASDLRVALRRPCATVPTGAPAPRRSPAPRSPQRQEKEVSNDADRLRRPGEDGQQHGAAHPPRLRARGRRLRLRARRRAARGEERSQGRPLAEGARQGSAPAAHGVAHGARRRPDAADGRRARQ